MGEEAVATAVLRMLDDTDPAARERFIAVVLRLENWRMTPQEVWRRIRQAARPRRGVAATGRRHFDAQWVIAALQVCTYYGGPDYVSDLFAQARIDGRNERAADLQAERRGPVRVRPKNTDEQRRRA